MMAITWFVFICWQRLPGGRERDHLMLVCICLNSALPVTLDLLLLVSGTGSCGIGNLGNVYEKWQGPGS